MQMNQWESARRTLSSILDNCWTTFVILAVLVSPTRAQEQPLFPNALPREVEATVGRRATVIPDGTDGMHYFPDGPLSILSTRPLRFLMAVETKTLLVTGQDFSNLTSQEEVVGPSGNGPDANYAGVYSTWRRGPKDRILAIYHGENWDGMGKIESNGINGAMFSVCLAIIDPASTEVERRGEILRADKPKRPVAGQPHELATLRVQGVGEPSMTPDRDGRYLLCYYTEASTGLIAVCASAWLAAQSRRTEHPDHGKNSIKIDGMSPVWVDTTHRC